jgi:hypothetical protein
MGRLQNEDFKSVSDLTAAGSDQSHLLNDTKIYVTANSLNTTLNAAITSGQLGGSGGTGDDLSSSQFMADLTELFADAPTTTTTTVNSSSGYTNAVYQGGALKMYAMKYDSSKTATASSASLTLSGAPSFTVAAGDVVVNLATGEVKRITAVASQTSYTLESAFSVSLSAQAVTVSQALHTKDLYNLTVDTNGNSIASAFPGSTFSEILVFYKDNNTVGSNQWADAATNCAFTASPDNSAWTTLQTKTVVTSSSKYGSTILPSAGSKLYLRFFANQSSGSGTVNLLMYKAYMQKAVATQAGGVLWSAYGTTNNATTPVNCTISTPGSYTLIQLTNGYQYAVGVNTGQTYGSVDVYLNGQLLPRYVAGSVPSTDGYYTEVSGNTIQLDKNYSAQNLDVQIVQRTQVIDTSTTNTSAITALQSSVAGISGSKNYLLSYTASLSGNTANPGNGNFEKGTTAGWSLAHTALSGVTPTSTATAGNALSASSGGSAASGTLSLGVAAQQLAGSYSGSLTSTGASTAGDCLLSSPFYMDREDQAKVLSVRFNYSVASGGTNLVFAGSSANSFALWIYDVLNASWIQPAGVYNLVQSSGVGLCTATFQTSSNGTQYQLALVNINASTGAFSLYVDDFYVGPQVTANAPAMSDPVSYVPVVGGGGVIGASALLAATYSRTGKFLRITYNLSNNGSAGTAGSGNYTFSIPSGLSIDTSQIVLSGMPYSTAVGAASWGNGTTSYQGVVSIASATTLEVLASNTILGSSNSGWGGTGYNLSFEAVVPIVGWSSNSVSSADTLTQVVAASYSTSGSISGSATQPFNFATQLIDTSGAVTTGSAWNFKCPVAGLYQVSASLLSATGTGTCYVYKNGVNTSCNVGSVVTTAWATGTVIIQCNAGDTLDIRPGTSVTLFNTGENRIYIQRLSGPAVITATESVNACYTNSAAGTTIAVSAATIPYTNKVFDSHSAYNTSTGIYTVPVSGKYLVTASFLTATVTLSTTQFIEVSLVQTGSVSRSQRTRTLGNGASNTYAINYVAEFNCLAGDTLYIQADSSVATTMYTDATFNEITFTRVGN